MGTENQPLYVQVADEMRNNIRIEKWQEGHKIPTEFELCDIFHVSRITIRKAIEELVREKLLVRKKPVGTFVAERKLVDDKQNYTIVKSFTNEMKELGIKFETLKVNVIVSHADHTIANFLNITPGEKIIILKRLRGNKGKPIGYFITYFKYEEYFSLNTNDYEHSFYDYLNSLDIHITSNQEVVESVLPTKEVATILKVSNGTPLLKRCRFTSDAYKNFYEYTECYYIGNEYKYFIDFTR